MSQTTTSGVDTAESFPAGVFDLRGLPPYQSAEDAKYGAFSLDYAELHHNTVVNALRRILDHVSSNESIAPASTARTKDPTLSDEAYAKIVRDTRDKLFGRMKAGEWGEKGTRAPRQVGVDTLDQIRNQISAQDTRAMIAKKGWTKVEGKADEWVVGDKIYTLAQMVAAFRGNKEEGPARVASIERRALAEFESRRIKAEEAKAAKERAAAATKPQTDENGGLVL